jgi:hypothetical protein
MWNGKWYNYTLSNLRLQAGITVRDFVVPIGSNGLPVNTLVYKPGFKDPFLYY